MSQQSRARKGSSTSSKKASKVKGRIAKKQDKDTDSVGTSNWRLATQGVKILSYIPSESDTAMTDTAP